MEKYKPAYLGKTIYPADDTTKLTDFVQNKYEAFSMIYDSCKDESNNISDIRIIENSDDEDITTLSIKISADESAVVNISEKIKDDQSIIIKGDVITARIVHD